MPVGRSVYVYLASRQGKGGIAKNLVIVKFSKTVGLCLFDDYVLT